MFTDFGYRAPPLFGARGKKRFHARCSVSLPRQLLRCSAHGNVGGFLHCARPGFCPLRTCRLPPGNRSTDKAEGGRVVWMWSLDRSLHLVAARWRHSARGGCSLFVLTVCERNSRSEERRVGKECRSRW